MKLMLFDFKPEDKGDVLKVLWPLLLLLPPVHLPDGVWPDPFPADPRHGGVALLPLLPDLQGLWSAPADLHRVLAVAVPLHPRR